VADLADAGRDLVIERAEPPAPLAMPALAGFNLAAAKEQLRAAGYRDIHASDAKGERAVLWPRNWTVVGQDPASGVALVPGQRITLTVSHNDGR
jgi:beta-lactam-binding protein with PASTA domain